MEVGKIEQVPIKKFIQELPAKGGTSFAYRTETNDSTVAGTNILLLESHLESNGRADLNPLDTKNHS
jgi:hypothetical protein